MDNPGIYALPIAISAVVGLIVFLMICWCRTVHEQNQAEKGLQSCPHCGRQVAASTHVCPRCEQKLGVPSSPKGVSAAFRRERDVPPMRECSVCGRAVKGSICTNVHCDFFGKPAEPAAKPTERDDHTIPPGLWTASSKHEETREQRIGRYRSATGWSVWLHVTILVQLGLSIALVHQAVMQQQLFMNIDAGVAKLTRHDLEQRQVFLSLLVLGMFVMAIAIMVTMAGWVYNSYRNLGPLRAERMTYSPGSAAAYAVLPIVSFIMLWPVLLELWKGSDPWRITRRDIIARFQFPWLIYVLLILVLMGIPPSVYTLNAFKSVASVEAASKLNIIGLVLDVIGCLQIVVFLLIVNRISRNQGERHAVLTREKRKVQALFDGTTRNTTQRRTLA